MRDLPPTWWFSFDSSKKRPLLRIKVNKYDQRQGLVVCKFSKIMMINTKIYTFDYMSSVF
jgi:hypothetical protein